MASSHYRLIRYSVCPIIVVYHGSYKTIQKIRLKTCLSLRASNLTKGNGFSFSPLRRFSKQTVQLQSAVVFLVDFTAPRPVVMTALADKVSYIFDNVLNVLIML